MKIKIVTIGVYGFDESSFFDALCKAEVDTFCDIRSRRGVRGATYAFANSARLQARLSELGIRYLYRKDLGPTKTVRDKQAAADKKPLKLLNVNAPHWGKRLLKPTTVNALPSLNPKTYWTNWNRIPKLLLCFV